MSMITLDTVVILVSHKAVIASAHGLTIFFTTLGSCIIWVCTVSPNVHACIATTGEVLVILVTRRCIVATPFLDTLTGRVPHESKLTRTTAHAI